MAARPGELNLEITRVLPASPSVAFAAFSEATQVAKWFGPQGFTATIVEFDPRVGGSYRIEMQPPEGESFHLTGVFREVSPPDRVAYTFVYEPPDPDDVQNLVGLLLRDLDGSTEVRMVHGPFKTEARRALHRDGWTDSFDKLERLLSVRS